jgi:hypothetical protein
MRIVNAIRISLNEMIFVFLHFNTYNLYVNDNFILKVKIKFLMIQKLTSIIYYFDR